MQTNDSSIIIWRSHIVWFGLDDHWQVTAMLHYFVTACTRSWTSCTPKTRGCSSAVVIKTSFEEHQGDFRQMVRLHEPNRLFMECCSAVYSQTNYSTATTNRQVWTVWSIFSPEVFWILMDSMLHLCSTQSICHFSVCNKKQAILNCFQNRIHIKRQNIS